MVGPNKSVWVTVGFPGSFSLRLLRYNLLYSVTFVSGLCLNLYDDRNFYSYYRIRFLASIEDLRSFPFLY